MKLKLETMTLLDLVHLKSILEERLKKVEKWRDAERGYNYEECCRRDLVYKQDENHEKLNRINQRIDEFIKVI